MAAARVKLAALFVAYRPCPARMNRAGASHGRPLTPSRVFPFLCRSTALVSDIIAPLHFTCSRKEFFDELADNLEARSDRYTHQSDPGITALF